MTTTAAPRLLTDTEARRLNAARPTHDSPTYTPGLVATDPPAAGEDRLTYLLRTAGLSITLDQEMILPGYWGTALFDHTQKYRYALARRWAAGRAVVWIMLNPSTADAGRDDATIRRCVGYTKRWGFASMLVLNLCAVRCTDPRMLRRHTDPVGPDNDAIITAALTSLSPAGEDIGRVIVAWGNHAGNPAIRGRDVHVARLVRRVWGAPLCLALTASGRPAHPLRLAGNLIPIEYPGIAG